MKFKYIIYLWNLEVEEWGFIFGESILMYIIQA